MRFLGALPLLIGLAAAAPTPGHPVGQPVTAGSRGQDLVVALEVLHGWDARRAEAWATVDEEAVRSLYVSGSLAGRADVRLLRAYADRGLVVRRLVTQVFAVRLLHRDAESVRLRVFDRVAGGEVTREGDPEPLGSSRPVTRTVELRLVSGSWRVAAVSRSGGAPHAVRR
jgi:hypothetical protein